MYPPSVQLNCWIRKGLQVIPTAGAGDSADMATTGVTLVPWFCDPGFRRVCSEQRQHGDQYQLAANCYEMMHEVFHGTIIGKVAL
jgi:hypothetical protein